MPQKLSETIHNIKLQDLFQKYGAILSCKVAMFEDGKGKGYGFVQFESDESAAASIEKLIGIAVDGKQMYVQLCFQFHFNCCLDDMLI